MFPKHFLYGCARVFPCDVMWEQTSDHDWSVLDSLHPVELVWGQAQFVAREQLVQNPNGYD